MPGPKNTASNKLTTQDFINNDEVKKCLQTLKANFGEGGERLIVSDVIDGEKHQYVNLVQKGGGVLGVALVGYTYILEQMGIRFIRLAGTSAGAINTALMAVVGSQVASEGEAKGNVQGDKKKAKSVAILEIICDLNFFDLVDGHPVARWVIERFITHKDFSKRLSRTLMLSVLGMIGLPALAFISIGIQHHAPWVSYITKTVFILTGFYYMLVTVVVLYFLYLIKHLKNSGFGINPGDFFYDWLKIQLRANNVKTVSDLIAVASTPIPDIRLRDGVEGNTNDLEGDVTFITSELVTQNKIQFPKNWPLFAKDKDHLQPAGFIRASMSIPIFFESYFIARIPCTESFIKEAWAPLGEVNPPSVARFVDGGILSNFPIDIFYNPLITVPRLPSLGIDLDDTKSPEEIFGKETTVNGEKVLVPVSPEEGDEGKHAESWSLTGYALKMFNTLRFYYDKDFLIKNGFFKKGIGTVPLKDFGWLNFFLEDEDKLAMFVLGAKAATKFLNEFDWEAYKKARILMHETIQNPTVTK